MSLNLSYKIIFRLFTAIAVTATFNAPVFANSLNNEKSVLGSDNPSCTDIPTTDLLEMQTNVKQDDNGSQSDSSKHSEHKEHNRSSKKNVGGKVWILQGKGEFTSTSSDIFDWNSENNSESTWDRDWESSTAKKIVTHVDLGLKNCDSWNEFAAKRDTALFGAKAKVEMTSINAQRDVTISGIEADAKKSINYEQQQTHRLAINKSAEVKLQEINVKGGLALAQFYTNLDLQPQGVQQ